MAHPPVIACFKWGKGYPVRDTNILFRALTDLMSCPFTFVCLTDDTAGLDDGITTLPLPDFRLERDHWVPGMWPKLAIFKPGLFADGTPILMIDVDVVVVRDLAPLFERIRTLPGLHVIKDWPNLSERVLPWRSAAARKSNSSVVGFMSGTQHQIWDRFHDAGWDTLQPLVNDQDFIHETATDRHHWPRDWVLSFKKSLVWHAPLGRALRPAGPGKAFVVAFHGAPNPEDLAQPYGLRWGTRKHFGHAPVPWVADYLARYGDR